MAQRGCTRREPCGTMNHTQCAHTSTRSRARHSAPLGPDARERALQAHASAARRGRARGRRRSGSRSARAAPERRGRRAATCTRPGRPTSAARRRPRRACASGAPPRTGRTARRRRRPAATIGGRADALAHQRRGDTRRDHPPGGCSESARPPHAAEYMPAPARSRQRPELASRRRRALRALARAAADQGADDRAHRVGLGVPLHAEHERAVGQLDRLARPSSDEVPLTRRPSPRRSTP